MGGFGGGFPGFQFHFGGGGGGHPGFRDPFEMFRDVFGDDDPFADFFNTGMH